MEIETVENETVGTGLKYFYYTEVTDISEKKRFDTIILEYYPTVDRVIITEVDNVYKTQYNCSDVYEYDSMLPENANNQTDSEYTEEACYLFDGQRFECFETVSGEDITLTVHLYYSDDSSTPSSYKGELSNGVEFWFEPYENSSECVTYKIDCMDGTTAYLKYSFDTSEIVFIADGREEVPVKSDVFYSIIADDDQRQNEGRTVCAKTINMRKCRNWKTSKTKELPNSRNCVARTE